MEKENTNKRVPMKNITINIPDIYDENIEKLIKLRIIRNRSECIRLALKEFLQKEFSENLDLLGYFKKK
ncbi:MAG: ribbon-helix-helix domain-containing protein [Promethearchaeota archaeon]